ncbi:MAG: hypothetical protein PHQ95_03275 [Candidatus Gracilibacteria bacterium]|nr:hypothetical protein [Candidatus Gracilibacteria bacterium]
MITYQITRFIHSVIRNNKLIHLVDALLEKSRQDESLIDDLITQFKRFLQKGNDEIFEQNRLKYVTYLDDFKTHLSDIKNLGKQDTMEINSLLLEIYEIPKKRNNLLSVFLFYFYLKNHQHLQGKIIFKIIYLYFLIITYRNRLDISTRTHILKIDKKNLRPVGELITNSFQHLRTKYRLPSLRSILLGGVFLSLLSVSIISWKYVPLASNLRADISATVQSTNIANNGMIEKIALGTLMLGPLTDALQGLDMQNVLIVALLVVIFQSLRTGFTNLFVNSFMSKTFRVVGHIFKIFFRIIFSIYNYVIYKFSTRYIFASVDILISRNILPGPMILSLFCIGYIGIYIAIISIYILSLLFFFGIHLVLWQIAGIIIGITSLLIGINLHTDITNFRAFLLEIENILKSLRNGKTSNTEKIS